VHRDNGVSEFPDPDASGRLTFDAVVNGSSLDPSSAAWKTAIGACEDLQRPGFTGDEEVTAEEQETRLEFAQCMRENDVKDFPAFRTWWAAHNVRYHETGTKRLHHPVVGDLEVSYEVMGLIPAPGSQRIEASTYARDFATSSRSS
jgi:hypothetical protein